MFEKARYVAGIRLLHWLMAFMVLAAYIAIEQRGLFERGSPGRFAMMQTHFWLGIGIFILVWIRLKLRFKHGAPRITPPLPVMQQWISGIFHIALYAFLIGMPILGLLTAWYDGKTLFIPFTDIALPTPVVPDKVFAHKVEDLHHDIGEWFYWVFGLHIAAALYHHYIRKDDTLSRMS